MRKILLGYVTILYRNDERVFVVRSDRDGVVVGEPNEIEPGGHAVYRINMPLIEEPVGLIRGLFGWLW